MLGFVCKSAVGIACGYQHSMILMSDGTVLAFGYNAYGQLGVGDAVNRLTPSQIGWTGFPTIGIAAGGFHSLLMRSDGTIMSFGLNNAGQLGLGDSVNRNIPTNGTSVLTGLQVYGMGCGMFHSVVVILGRLVTFGANWDGQLGTSSGVSSNSGIGIDFGGNKITEIAVGPNHCVTTLENRSFTSFGMNSCGELGLGFSSTQQTATLIGKLMLEGVVSNSTSNNNIKFQTTCGVSTINSSTITNTGNSGNVLCPSTLAPSVSFSLSCPSSNIVTGNSNSCASWCM